MFRAIYYRPMLFVLVSSLAEIGSTQQCLEERYAQVTDLLGYLTTYSTFATEMGSDSCPWRIRASPGQRINLTLFNLNTVGFGNASAARVDLSTRTGSRQHCAEDAIATVRETLEDGATIEKMICHTVNRVASIYTSQGDRLTISLSSAFRRDVNGSAKYILKYEGKLASLSWLSSLSLLIVLPYHLVGTYAIAVSLRQSHERCTTVHTHVPSLWLTVLKKMKSDLIVVYFVPLWAWMRQICCAEGTSLKCQVLIDLKRRSLL